MNSNGNIGGEEDLLHKKEQLNFIQRCTLKYCESILLMLLTIILISLFSIITLILIKNFYFKKKNAIFYMKIKPLVVDRIREIMENGENPRYFSNRTTYIETTSYNSEILLQPNNSIYTETDLKS